MDDNMKNDERKNRGLFRTVGHYVAVPFKYVARTIGKNPGSTIMGTFIGGAITVGGKYLYDFFFRKPDNKVEDEPIETEEGNIDENL